MAIHFAITGAKGTGKSTLVERLASRFEGCQIDNAISFVASPGSTAKSKRLPLGRLGSDKTHIFFATEHLKAIRTGSDQLRVMDRCLIDHLAYVRTLSEDSSIIELMSQLTRICSKHYSMVFVARLHRYLPLLDDDTESEDFRRTIEAEILSILNEFEVPHMELPTSLDCAVDQISTVICSATGLQ